jgi:tRNA-specific 2-thiouridylase
MLKAKDSVKDQTFFLSQIDKELLDRILFPIGGLLKSEVSRIASDIGLERITKKKSSTGICMVGKRNFVDFIGQYLPVNKGSIVDLETNLPVGEHAGIHNFTVGQRLVIDDKYYVKKVPFFVAKKDVVSNSVYVVSTFFFVLLFSCLICYSNQILIC